MERTQTATYSIIAGLLLVSAGSLGAGTGHAASGASLMSATSACAHRPATTTSASTVKKAQAATDAKDAAVITNKAQSAASAAPTPAAATASATPTPTATPTATDPATPSATTTPTPSTSPTPDPSATPTPTKTPTPTPTATPSPKPGTAQLCVLVQPFSSSKVHPGGNATYAIWVWSTGVESTGATVTVTIGQVSDVESPTFTVCAEAKGDVCTVGDLLTSQSDELVAAAHVRDTAAAGEKVTLTATAKATKASSFDADSTIDVVAASTSTGSGTTTSGGVGDSLPGTSLPTLPDGSFTSTAGSDPSGLFPTVSPSGSATASSSPGRNGTHHVDATTVSSTLPLDSRLIGGQLAGLVVLASAIAIAITRLSLRSRPHDGAGPQK